MLVSHTHIYVIYIVRFRLVITYDSKFITYVAACLEFVFPNQLKITPIAAANHHNGIIILQIIILQIIDINDVQTLKNFIYQWPSIYRLCHNDLRTSL